MKTEKQECLHQPMSGVFFPVPGEQAAFRRCKFCFATQSGTMIKDVYPYEFRWTDTWEVEKDPYGWQSGKSGATADSQKKAKAEVILNELANAACFRAVDCGIASPEFSSSLDAWRVAWLEWADIHDRESGLPSE